MALIRQYLKFGFENCQTIKWTMRLYSTSPPAAPAAPLLLKIRQDLKPAMQSKDANRLNVLRGVIHDATQATKSNEPIITDLHVLALLRKRLTAAQEAAESFEKSGRSDLKEKEEAQISVIKEYATSVETVSDEEVRTRVGEVLNDASLTQESGQKLNKGTIMKKLIGPGGTLEGKPVEKRTIAQMVDEALGVS